MAKASCLVLSDSELANYSDYELNTLLIDVLKVYDEITHAILIPEGETVIVSINGVPHTLTNKSASFLTNEQVAYLGKLSTELVCRYLCSRI